MDPSLLAIGALGLLGFAGVVLLSRRLGRVESALDRLDELEALSRRVGSLAGELERKELSGQMQTRLAEVGEGHRRLVAAVAEFQEDLRAVRRELEQQHVSQALHDAESLPDVGRQVREHLADRGFTEIQLLSDLQHLEGRSGRVVFEARRDGVTHKGHLTLEDGEVVDDAVRAAYAAFP